MSSQIGKQKIRKFYPKKLTTLKFYREGMGKTEIMLNFKDG